MKITYKIRDRRGERTIAEDMFPIIIGTGPTADIRIDELTADVEVAYIGLSENRPFIQAGQADVQVRYNHRKLEGSAWLMHGDSLEIGTCKINYTVEGNDFIIQVVGAGSVTVSGPAPSAEAADQPLTIKPLSFRSDRRRPAAGSMMRHRRFIGSAIGLSLLLLSAAVWFVFDAKQITISIEPVPDRISISGSLIAPRLGEY